MRQTKKLVRFRKYLARQAYLADVSRVQNLYVWSLPGSQQYGLIKIAITFVIDPRPKRTSICLETGTLLPLEVTYARIDDECQNTVEKVERAN